MNRISEISAWLEGLKNAAGSISAAGNRVAANRRVVNARTRRPANPMNTPTAMRNAMQAEFDRRAR